MTLEQAFENDEFNLALDTYDFPKAFSFLDEAEEREKLFLLLQEESLNPLTGFTEIPADFFKNCSKITKIEIPYSVTSICNDAFRDSNLKSIVIPENVSQIGMSVFDGSKNLESVFFNNSLSIIPHWCFTGCTKLTTVKFPSNLEKISYLAFAHCGFENITIPHGVKELKECFYDMPKLKTVTIPNSVETISERLFHCCHQLTTINFEGTMREAKKLGIHYKKYLGKCSIKQIICTDGVINL